MYLTDKIDNNICQEIQSLYNFDEIKKIITSKKFKVKCEIDAIKDNILISLKIIDSNKLKGKFLDKHYKHSIISSYILNTEYNYSINSIQIIYFLMSLNNIQKFDLKLNNEEALKILESSNKLIKSLSENKVPEIFNRLKNQCDYCTYINICKNELSQEKNKSIFLL